MGFDEKEHWDAVFERVREIQRAEAKQRLCEAAERRRKKAEEEEARHAESKRRESHGFWEGVKRLLH